MGGITAVADPQKSGPIPWRSLGDAVLRHGYTLAEANRLSMVAVRQAWGPQWAGNDDRLENAWFAIVEQLYAAEERPAVVDLLRAATNAIHSYDRNDRQFHGIGPGGGTRRSFESYWWSTASHTANPESRVTDRMALAQIWPLLLPRYQRAFTALAAHGDYRLAAAALGKSYNAFGIDIYRGRQAFLALWHEGEAPSRPWGSDRRSATGGAVRGSVTNRTVQRRQRRRAKLAAANGGTVPARPRGRVRIDLGISDDELVRRYLAGETVGQLAACVGKPFATIRYRLVAAGVYAKPQKRASPAKERSSR